VIGVTALVESAQYFSGFGLEPKGLLVGLVLVVSGILLLIGLRTAPASVVFASFKLATLVSWIGISWVGRARAADSPSAALYAIAIAIAVALLGPGSVSLDARLYGPREIIIPAAKRRS
jgi:uncharacterized membrane protein YphA (DoxX/SURF4 family)